MKHRAFNFYGNIAVISFPDGINKSEKIKFANSLLKKQKTIKTVLEKKGRIKGRLRKISTKHLVGEKNKEILYKENGCVFRFNMDDTYFSPRLSNERKEISGKIKKNDEVLVMFAGVGPFSIVMGRNSKAKKVYSNELNKKANKYAELNIQLNKLIGKVELLPGDIKKVTKKLVKEKKKFDVIVMPRPRLKDTYLEEAFKLSKKGTKIYYYDFCKVNEVNSIIGKVKNEAKKASKKIKILRKKSAGEIAPYKIRVRVDIKVG